MKMQSNTLVLLLSQTGHRCPPEIPKDTKQSRRTRSFLQIFQCTLCLQQLPFQKSLSPLFLFSKFILQMPIQQKAQTTKELKLSETTLEELYHPCGRLSSLFVRFSDLFQVKTLCQGVLSFF